MQLPTSTLFLLLFSFTSVLLVEGKYHPPSTASPDYQKCKHGVESDPSCIPLTSDESVSMIRDSKGRFLLLNEKHPELKSHIRQQTKSPYVTPTSTSESISTQTLDGTVVVVSPTPKAPALVAPELSTGAIAESTQAAGKRSNDEETRKFGGPSDWGKPLLIKKDSNDFIIPFFGGSTSNSDLADQHYLFDSNHHVLKRSPKDCLEETTIFSTATATATSIQTVIQYQTITAPLPPTPTQTSINTLTSSEPNVSSNDDVVEQGQSQVGENVGNKKWGFNGGWGRPWKRQYDEYISTLLSFYPNPAPAPAPVAVPAVTQLAAIEDTTGNKKWGFSGGWGRPWKRQDFTFLNSNPQTQSLPEAQPAPIADNTGNKKWGFSGGWGRPWKRQDTDLLPYSQTPSSSSSSSPTSTPQLQPAPVQPAPTGDDTGNKKWGFSGGWGRPWKRQGLIDGNSPFTLFSFASPFPQSQSLPQTQSLIQAQAQTQISDAGNEDVVGNKKWGFSGGWGRPW